jgi:ABC-type nitrate/sulfonate/bicarbonate transport system permease component
VNFGINLGIYSFIWYIISTFVFKTDLFPSPQVTLITLFGLLKNGEIWVHTFASLTRVGVGLFLAIIIGIVTGIFASLNKYIKNFLIPGLTVFRSFPPVALIPLMIVWLGINDNAKIIAIVITSFPSICMEIFFGIKQMPLALIRKAKLLTNNNFKILIQVYIPYSLPFLLQGIRNAIHIALVMLFVTELSGSSQGLGYFISTTQLSYRIDQMIVGLLILGIIGWFGDYLIVKLFQKAFIWLKI